jgi:uncharacterized membrane protein YkoI
MNLKKNLSFIVLAILTVCLLTLSTQADQKITKKDVPTAVITAFEKAYPKATIRGYGTEKENGHLYYEIESTDGKVMRDILYNPDGSVAEVEETIPENELPAGVMQSINKQYPGAKITKAEKVTHADKMGYELQAKQGEKKISMELDSAGKILKSKAKEASAKSTK